MRTKQFSDKTIHRQRVKTGFLRKWETEVQDFSMTIPGLFHSSMTRFLPNSAQHNV